LHAVPSKHLPVPQSQALTGWLLVGEHPQAPMRQRFGKSLAEPQQLMVVTLPPELMHACSCADTVGDTGVVGAVVAVGVGVVVGCVVHPAINIVAVTSSKTRNKEGLFIVSSP
jgi:hypothetical protein